jgi:hypothetical protein
MFDEGKWAMVPEEPVRNAILILFMVEVGGDLHDIKC